MTDDPDSEDPADFDRGRAQEARAELTEGIKAEDGGGDEPTTQQQVPGGVAGADSPRRAARARADSRPKRARTRADSRPKRASAGADAAADPPPVAEKTDATWVEEDDVFPRPPGFESQRRYATPDAQPVTPEFDIVLKPTPEPAPRRPPKNARNGGGGNPGWSPAQEPAAVVLHATRPVVEFAFHPHWVDADAVRSALLQLHPLVTILSGDHRLNARTAELAVLVGVKTAAAGDDIPKPDLVVVFADLDDDEDPAPALRPGAPHLMVSHSSRRRGTVWRLAHGPRSAK